MGDGSLGTALNRRKVEPKNQRSPLSTANRQKTGDLHYRTAGAVDDEARLVAGVLLEAVANLPGVGERTFYAFTQSEAVARQLTMIYGATAIIAPALTSTDEMMDQMDRILVERGLAKPGDNLVFVAGQPIGKPGSTNMLKLHTVEP